MIIHAQNIISRHHEWWHMNVFDMQHLSNEDKKKNSHTVTALPGMVHFLGVNFKPW